MASSSVSRLPLSGSYLWTFPGCPVRIVLPLSIVERLRAEVLQDTAAEHEIGGLLIANPSSTPGDVDIVDFFPLPPESPATGRNFTIRPDSLAQAARTCAAVQRRVVGFYRSHLGSRIQLRPDDLELIQKYFKDPADVFLVIRPHDGQASAGFFFWQGDTVFGDFSLNFPLSAVELKSRSWATLVGGAAQRRPPSVFSRTLSRAIQVATQARVLLLCCVIALVAGVAFLMLREGTFPAFRPATAPDSSHTLGLHVERDGVNLLVRWDRSAPEIVNAHDANLLIWDGGAQPLFVQLSPAQLRTGSVSYTSGNDRVEFRLDVIGPSGNARTESTVSIAGSPYVRTPAPDLGMPAGSIRDTGQRRQDAAPFSLPLPSFVKPAPATQPPAAAKTSPAKPEPRLFSPAPAAPATPPVSAPELAVPVDIHVAANQAPPLSTALQAEHAAAPPPPSKPIPPAQSQTTTSPPAAANPAPPPRVGGAFLPAQAIREQPPVVPPEMKFLVRSDTTVDIQVHIDETGKVVSAKVLSKTGMFLARPALEAAQRWQFAPARLNNKPVASDKVLQFVFRAPSR